MAIWPFRRKGSRKRSPNRGRDDEEMDAPPRPMTEPAMASNVATVSGPERPKNKRQRGSSGHKKLSRRGRTYSFSPGRPDSIRVAQARQESVPPLPTGPIPAAINDDYGDKGQGFIGSPAREDEIRDRTPTLHHNNSRNKRRGQPLPRKKSSKRRKEDHDREAEVKAMSHSQSLPARAATESWIHQKPSKREGKRAKTGSVRDWRRPDSDISLPIPESMHSAMSSDSEHISYKVSAFDALAPRPTIRYASNPVFAAPSHSGPLRAQSQKRKISERGPISEATLKAHKRVDDLADDLDASDLRELMERDKRRKERKQEKERERVERRLARRAERQRAEEAEARQNGNPPPQNLERGVMGREAPAVGADTTSAVVTSSRRRQSVDSLETPGKPAEPKDFGRQRTPSPLDKFHREDSFATEPAELIRQGPSRQRPVAEGIARDISRSPSPRIIGYMRSRKRRSKSPLPQDVAHNEDQQQPTRIVSKSESESVGRRTSDTAASSKPWMSIFKWPRGAKSRRGSDEPSSFSNTSRDSMLAGQPPSQSPSHVPIQRVNSKIPKRTMSRFREDLPELPLSPPDSRVGSPEAEPPHPEPLPIITDDVAMRYDTPTSGHRGTPSLTTREDLQPSPAPHSMSMASIDSEGSWFSSRVTRKRASSGMRGSPANYPLRSVSGGSEEHDDDAAHDDEFLKIVTDEKKLHRGSTGEALPSSDEEEESEQSPKWGNVTRTPTFTHHRQTMRSSEGLLLQSFDDDDKDFASEKGSEKDSEGASLGGDSPIVPQRARSVNFGRGHIRNFSAGSAKLLDISPRVSTDKRRSFDPNHSLT
ncbi:hypothetical protein SCAR479_06599 [Seiridium cardinale]|uniref:Uncharacterized protein n=1 Tax=Seiridium cardinale TaxID=138064 RepID=A0ABR2XTC4_9PEZI